jgi:hypothetical protein
MHVPVPLHACVLTTVPWQVGLPQAVPDAHSSQAPAPLHAPSVPQVDGACMAHSLSGSVPAVMAPQVPSAPLPFFAAVHAWQRPVQAVLQQTPSTQEPDWHCAAVEQAAPLASGAVQTPALQTSPEMQSALLVQGFLQAPAAQA